MKYCILCLLISTNILTQTRLRWVRKIDKAHFLFNLFYLIFFVCFKWYVRHVKMIWFERRLFCWLKTIITKQISQCHSKVKYMRFFHGKRLHIHTFRYISNWMLILNLFVVFYSSFQYDNVANLLQIKPIKSIVGRLVRICKRESYVDTHHSKIKRPTKIKKNSFMIF